MATDKNCSKLELNLNEENEIGFKLKIEGTDKEIRTATPKIRFTITEAKTGRGWIFNAERGAMGDDGVAVTIPYMKGMVTEGQSYSGKLEVIMGTRYFTPTEVDIDFIEPLKIEAAITSTKVSLKEHLPETEEESQVLDEAPEPLSVESEIDSIIVKEKPDKETKPPAAVLSEQEKEQKSAEPKVAAHLPKTKLSYSDMSDKEKAVANTIFIAECRKRGIENPRKYLREGTTYTKRRLKAMIASATKQVLAKRNNA